MSAEFSLAGFAAHLAVMAAEAAAEEHHLLEKGARIVEDRAKANLGTYQGQAGPFAAWQELADATKEDRVRQGYTPNNPGLRSGDMRDEIGHVVHGHEADIGSNDPKLVYFEEGTIKQPARHVLGGAAFQSGPEVAEVIGTGMVAVLKGQRGTTLIPTE